MRGFPRKRQFCSRAVEFRAPLNELRDVFRTFFDQKSHGFGAAQTITSIDGVLLVQPDFIFVGEGYGDPSLSPSRCRIA